MKLEEREFWYRYSRDAQSSALMGIIPITWQTFKFVASTGEHTSRSMLSIHEMALLYSLGRHFYTGRGMIIDAGPLLGASTFALARGLADNTEIADAQRSARIYSYDLWRSQGYEKFLGDTEPVAITGSLLPEFLATVRPYLHSIVPHQGDFISWSWPQGAPIEILFLDLAKSWALNAHAVRQHFPCLIGGESVLIQQDYVHFNEYWIHITMEHFSDHFEPLGYIWGATAYYRCVKAISAAQAAVDLRALPYDQKMSLLARARTKAPRGVQQVMLCAAAKCAIENGRLDDAAALLAEVDLDVAPEHPTMDFRGIAKSNHGHMATVLDGARKKQPS